MTRDYKDSVAKQPPNNLWWRRSMDFLSGLSVGLFVLLLVHLDLVHLPSPSAEPAVLPEGRPAPERQADDEVVEHDFTFFTILPEFEIKVPDWSLSMVEEEAGVAGRYLLQVGSFRRYQDADRRKATLALRGIGANIQRAVINGQEVWFRVMVGPVAGKSELHEMRQKLIESGMDTMISRLKAEAPT